MRHHGTVALVVIASLSASVTAEQTVPPSRAQSTPAHAAPAPSTSAPPAPAATTIEGPAPTLSVDQSPAAGLWKDPEFQKGFLGSYGSLSELEPRLSAEERLQLEKVLPLMGTDPPKAAEQLAAIVTPQSSAVLDFTLANLRFQQDQLEEAAAGYRTAVAKFPRFQRGWKNLGLTSFRLGRMADAIPAFTKMVELGGGDGLTYGLLAHAYSSEQKHVSAESAYRMAALLQPDSLDWRIGLARSLVRQRKHAEAASLTAELLEAHTDRAELWQLQAAAFLGMKEPLKAAENYEILARMGKASVETLNTLGDIYVNESLMDLAAKAYASAIDLDPSQCVERPMRAAEVLAARGAADPARGMIAKIEAVFKDRMEETDRRKLLKLKARLEAAEGRGDEAAAVLEEIVALDPLDGEALLLLGQHHARLGELDKAIFYYERAESLEAFEADAVLRHAQVLVARTRFQEAVPLIKRAQELKPRDEVARYLEQVERIARGK